MPGRDHERRCRGEAFAISQRLAILEASSPARSALEGISRRSRYVDAAATREPESTRKSSIHSIRRIGTITDLNTSASERSSA